MTDVEKYITPEAWDAVQGAIADEGGATKPDDILRAVLPGILAQHRADVLREVDEQVQLFCSRSKVCTIGILREKEK